MEFILSLIFPHVGMTLLMDKFGVIGFIVILALYLSIGGLVIELFKILNTKLHGYQFERKRRQADKEFFKK